METLASLYANHLDTLQQRTRTLFQRHQLAGLLIHSGEPIPRFLDDQYYPFKANPHFNAWVPVTQVPHCWLWIDGVNKPKLWFYSPVDYWHSVEPLPDKFWTSHVDMQVLTQAENIAQQLPTARQHIAYIGSSPQRALTLGIDAKLINPKPVLDYFHYYRAYKTPYEQACMREVQKSAVAGHKVAQEAFQAKMSEFDINLAYLTATGHRDTDVPYDNIVALNEHASILHYTKLQHHCPPEYRSGLIDAGAEYNGYAADITRTYAAQPNDDFAGLINEMDKAQQALINTLKVGQRYTDYHIQFHHQLAGILLGQNILQNISAEAAVENGLTSPFFPHGLGHLLGLQIHDVAGFMQDENGTQQAAPEKYPYLRCTRVMEPDMVLTIEPGLYFIDSLLARWQQGKHRHHFNWQTIDHLRPYGGIRIEDNVIFHDRYVENMTRDLHLD